MSTERNLKEALMTRAKKEIISMESLNFNNEIYLGEQGDFLKQKSYEIATISIKGALALGKIFEEVYNKLGKESGSGIYIEWLKTNNFNRITAWRYRQKYNLYVEVSEKGKEIVALLPFDIISLIYQQDEENRKAIINLINDGAGKEEIKELLSPLQIDSKIKSNEDFNFEKFNFGILEKEIKEKYNSLEEKEKKELVKLLEKIEKILKNS